MNKTKKIIQKILIIGVMVVGVYMFLNFQWPQPPAVSGLGFFMTGLAMWIPHCPLMQRLFGGKSE